MKKEYIKPCTEICFASTYKSLLYETMTVSGTTGDSGVISGDAKEQVTVVIEEVEEEEEEEFILPYFNAWDE